MPAFGAYAGGLNACDAAFKPLFPNGFTAHLIGTERIFAIARSDALPGLSCHRHGLLPGKVASRSEAGEGVRRHVLRCRGTTRPRAFGVPRNKILRQVSPD